jgi:hypothetical protein
MVRKNGVYTLHIDGTQIFNTSSYGTANFTTPAFVRIGGMNDPYNATDG